MGQKVREGKRAGEKAKAPRYSPKSGACFKWNCEGSCDRIDCTTSTPVIIVESTIEPQAALGPPSILKGRARTSQSQSAHCIEFNHYLIIMNSLLLIILPIVWVQGCPA